MGYAYIHKELLNIFVIVRKKSLKISKVWHESVNRRESDNTMATRNGTKGQIMIYTIYSHLNENPAHALIIQYY